MFESTVTGRVVDMQTYIKVILALYFDYEGPGNTSQQKHSDLMNLLHLLFK